MNDFDEDGAIEAGGWDPRYARVLAVAQRQDIAAVLIDSNGDGVDVDLDEYRRELDGSWQESYSGSVGDEGAGWSPEMVSTWGRAEPGAQVRVRFHDVDENIATASSGWWLFIWPSGADFDPDSPGALPERVS